jgi:hypothetical protein
VLEVCSVELTLTRADDPKITLRSIAYLAQLIADRQAACLYCVARKLQRDLEGLHTGGQVCVCPFRDFARDVDAFLATEPGPTPSCRACRRVRREARRFLGHDDPPPDAPCAVHGRCATHTSRGRKS